MRATSSRERKLIALGLLVAAIAIGQIALIAPILDGFRARAEKREALLGEYSHNVRAIASVPRLRRQAEAQRRALTRFVIAAPNANAATELLKERLERVVNDAGGEFQASDEAEAPAGWIGAHADARLTLDQLTRTLARLQNEPPFLVVDALDIAADEALVNGHLNPMDIKLAVSIPFRASPSR